MNGSQILNFAGASSPASPLNSTKKEGPEEARQAATEFESLLVGEMLKTIRESKEESCLGGETSAGNDAVMEMAEQQVARAIARNGGFGIGRMLERSFREKATPAPPSAASKMEGQPGT